ncbi:MAG: FG-GAP repeat domain-containing protein, partial [Planctomycetota bacterium]
PAVRIGRGYKDSQVCYVNGKARVLVLNKELVNFRSGENFEETVQIYPTENIHKANRKRRARQWKHCDYNGDGNLDLMAGVPDWSDYGWDNAYESTGKWTNGPLHGYVYVILNTGTTREPAYAEPMQVEAGDAPIDVYGRPSPNFADFDGDGDGDIICGSFTDEITFFENIGAGTEPIFAKGRAIRYKGRDIKMDLCMIIPVAIDWDKDGDIDLIVGEEDGRVSFIENTGKVEDSLPVFLPPRFFKQEADDVKFGALVTPYSYDWDSDGDEDLICGNTAGYVGFIENLGGGDRPRWAPARYLQADGEVIHIQAGYNGSIQGPAEKKWGYTTLSVADWDGDGLADIIINSIWGKVQWYRNIGTRKNPKLAGAKPIEVEWQGKAPKPAWFWWDPKGNELVTQWRTTPYVIDLNKDGLNDLVMLDHEGYLVFFERVKKGGRIALLPGKRIFKDEQKSPLQLNKRKAGKSGRRKLCMVDWDLDGKLDLLVNGMNIDFYRNISENQEEYVFKNEGMVNERVIAGHSTSPTVVDWDRNGVPDLLVGAEDGFLYYMKNSNALK